MSLHCAGILDDVDAEDLRAPRVGAKQGGQHSHQGGLARSVGPEQPENRPLAHLEIHPGERLGAPEALVHIADEYRVMVGGLRHPGDDSERLSPATATTLPST